MAEPRWSRFRHSFIQSLRAFRRAISRSHCPKCPNIVTIWHPNGAQNRSKMGYPIGSGSPNGYPLAPWRQERGTSSTVGIRTAHDCTKTASRRHCFQKSGQHGANITPTWPQLGIPNGANMIPKSMQKSITFLLPLGVDFWTVFDRCWVSK